MVHRSRLEPVDEQSRNFDDYFDNAAIARRRDLTNNFR